MVARNFSNVAIDTDLASGLSGGAASLTVSDPTGWPAAPFILIVEPGEVNEELIIVGAKAGAVFSSLTRGFGGTSDVGHSASDEVKHVMVGEDLSLTYSHIHKPGTDFTAAVTHADVLALGIDDHHDRDHLVSHHSGGADAMDHGQIAGLADDDHGLYLKEKASGGTAAETPTHDHESSGESGKLDHGAALDGLSGDDHLQYLNVARHNTEHAALRAIRITSIQSIPNDTTTTIVYNSVVRDDGDISHAVGTGIATVGSTGWYVITASIQVDGVATGGLLFRLLAGGASVATDFHPGIDTSGFNNTYLVSTIIYLTAAQTILVDAYHELGSGVQVFDSNSSYLAIAKLRD